MKKSLFAGIMLCMFAFSAAAQKKDNPSPVRLHLSLLNEDSLTAEDAEVVLVTAGGGSFIYPSAGNVFTAAAGDYVIRAGAPGYYPIELVCHLLRDTHMTLYLRPNMVTQQNFTVRAIQARVKSGFVYTNVSIKQMAAVNLGQDLTFLLGNTPSAVTTSDAGMGVGYTGIRIRGSDATRINVTVNGIPINDAESHGVFWVNMPDLASSASSIQIQRGVGSSTIGNGAFGANINIVNTQQSDRPFVQMQQSYGSFNTSKSTLQFGTGLMGKLNFSGRLSNIFSDGYIDRAFSDLQAFQFNLSWSEKKWNLHAVSFGGREKTYQSWYGTPESRVKGDVAGMNDFADRNWLSDRERENLLNSGRTYNYYTYDNQTDNYRQNHYQLHFSGEAARDLFIKTSVFLTTGKGFYEEFRYGASYSAYGVGDVISGGDTIRSTDLVRQRWLDNVYYGQFTSLTYKKRNTELLAGLGYTEYRGKHFGDVIWAANAIPFGKDFRYYESNSVKTEWNGFVKANHSIDRRLHANLEMQVRRVDYSGKGNDNDLKQIGFDTVYTFLNPKIGLIYDLDKKNRLYASYSVGSREPVRTDFIDNPTGSVPRPEIMGDLEAGFIHRSKGRYYQFNLYDMSYRNQLVLTGELNDVGSSLRKNAERSYRRGIELIVQQQIFSKISLDANLNMSRNVILGYEDVWYDYDNNVAVTQEYSRTNISFSPELVAFLGVSDHHIRNTTLQINGKYVGMQYLDNTLNKSRSLDPYFIVNFSAQKIISLPRGANLTLKGMVNNLTGIFYSNNGYTYKYVSSGILTTENFYYPQSGRNFMIGIDFKFL